MGARGDPTDPMALLMQQRIVFLGTQVRSSNLAFVCASGLMPGHTVQGGRPVLVLRPPRHDCLGLRAFLRQVDDFSADAVVSQLLYLDALDSTKVSGRFACPGAASSDMA